MTHDASRTTPPHDHPHRGRPGPEEWDARYAEDEHIWSGRPNHALTVEAARLPPGRALDVGCGEGARAAAHGIDPDDLLSPDDVPAALGPDWTVEVHERRERVISGGAGAGHRDDLVVRAVLRAEEPS